MHVVCKFHLILLINHDIIGDYFQVTGFHGYGGMGNQSVATIDVFGPPKKIAKTSNLTDTFQESTDMLNEKAFTLICTLSQTLEIYTLETGINFIFSLFSEEKKV